MKQVILDTNFILSCVKQKIDFFEEIPLMGISIIIPLQVIDELQKFSKQARGSLKEQAKLALTLLENRDFRRIDLHSRKVDREIINFAKQNPGIIIATLDREMKNKTQNSKMVIRRKKKLEII